MKPLYLIELIALSALWGASFLFMRMAVPEFGPIALIELRTGIAALFLLPIILWQKKLYLIKENLALFFILGFFSTALPFCLLSYTTLFVSAGYASILNATTPIFTAVIAWVWVKERLSVAALLGLVVGFLGVLILVFDKQGGADNPLLVPVLIALVATCCYGIGINFTKQKVNHVDAIAIAFGSQITSAIILFPLSIFYWPEQNPSFSSWVAVSALGVACTGVAFVLFFRLIANVGVNKAVSVTYLIPFFGVVWGILLLNEILTLYMAIGGAMILIGVALSTGLLSANIWRNSSMNK